MKPKRVGGAEQIDATIAGVCPDGFELSDVYYEAPDKWHVWLNRGEHAVYGHGRTFGKALMQAAGKAKQND